MQIHEIIRTRRTALGLTQEQLAGKLGVSAPAVNKWERGNSYPDITLLPVLARTLRVDLNTLLSFHDIIVFGYRFNPFVCFCQLVVFYIYV